ncbi:MULTISPECIES: IclR family transcriptional regulator [Amycolatopsis]|uniref:IclR family transcriptional regulator n=1 Tax=Amycolatopsis thermalba TaxID=944492 RepID=A0ABY4NXB9_9PSEU|nr:MULTISPECIES: IclR family transcriptional regulator [Amycolatopsis]OXM72465.1 IclR family transcriptional regulator [Amycolatopsis sp. KNN50.9b]UQS24683.1 IclR family transcriptional regulator [Amycolatopsis thermalba]
MANDGSVMLVRKVAQVLDHLAQGEATAAELAEALGEPRSSVYRLLSSLQAEGLVEHGSRRGQFRLGFKLLTLGTAVVARFDEREFAQPVLERLHHLTGETVFLCVRRGDAAVCIERLAGKRVQSLALQLGGSLPLHAGAASRALLAFAPETEWEAYLERNVPLPRFTGSTPAEPGALRKLLRQAREDGFALSDQDVTVGVAAIGVPVVDYRGEVRAAVSISGVRESILGEDFPRWRDLLLDAGQEVSRALGSELAGKNIARFD